jgi:hypothetical protein
VGAGLSALALGACASPSSLRADSRLRITAPAPLAVVASPFTVRWDADASLGNRFAVFVDQVPLAKGANLSSMADNPCRPGAQCPDDLTLRRKGVFVVSADEATIAGLPSPVGMSAQAAHPVRRLTVVAIDDSGRRVDDGAWEVEVRV